TTTTTGTTPVPAKSTSQPLNIQQVTMPSQQQPAVAQQVNPDYAAMPTPMSRQQVQMFCHVHDCVTVNAFNANEHLLTIVIIINLDILTPTNKGGDAMEEQQQ